MKMKMMLLRASVGVFAVAAASNAFAGGLGGLIVDAGYDLFQSEPSTQFDGVNFKGVPLGNYAFPAPVGTVSTGGTDTIIQRMTAVTVAAAGDTGSTAIQMDALQLETVAPTNVFGPMSNYFITLQSGVASVGTMNITFNSAAGGTFTSSLDVFFDVHMGSLTGSIVYSGDVTLTNSGDVWGRSPASGAVTILGANQNLNGANNSADFWPGVLTEGKSGTGQQVIQDATPEPSQWAMFAVPAIFGLIRRRRSRK